MDDAGPRIDPRWRVLYLLVVAVGVFLLKQPVWLLAVLSLQVALWLVVRLPLSRLGRQISKLWLFALFIVGSYAAFSYDPALDRWHQLELLGLTIPINLTGMREGALMVVRVLSVVLASQVARAGDPRAISAGLDKLRVPAVIAVSLDVVLALLGDGGGKGRGKGGGRGRGRRREPGAEPFMKSVRRLAKGDVVPIVERLERQIARANAAAGESLGAGRAELRRDVSIVAGVSLTMLAIKMLKLLPSLPFAPGHKVVLLTPLYIVAALLTKSRFGATATGLCMGTVAFLMGDGRYGIFEIFKHVAPGLVCDLLAPLMVRRGELRTGGWWAMLGAAVGLGRFATIFLVTLSVQPPKVAFAFLLPGIALNVFFGVMSGWVSYHVARAALALRERMDEDGSSAEAPSEPEASQDEPGSTSAPGGGGGHGDGRGAGRRKNDKRVEAIS